MTLHAKTRAAKAWRFSETWTESAFPVLSLLNLNASVEIRQSIGVKYACFDIFYDAEAGVSTMFVEVSSMMCNGT